MPPLIPASSASAAYTGAAYMGIDPGASGGLAYIWGSTVLVEPMPKTEKDLWELVMAWGGVVRRQGGLAVLEKVGGYRAGSGGNIGSAMFTFGTNYGLCRMALTAAGVPWDTVSPNTWQSRMGVPGNGADRAQHKNALKAKAQALFPDVKVTLKTADALLIVEYVRRMMLGRAEAREAARGKSGGGAK